MSAPGKPLGSLWRVKEHHAQGSHFEAGEVVRFIGGAVNDMFEHLDGHDHWYLSDRDVEPATEDKTLQDLAKDAMQVQDACNLSGVAGGLQRHVVALREIAGAHGKDWAWVDRHPTTLLWVDKLASLTGYPQSTLLAEYSLVGAIADGRNDGLSE